MDPAELMRRLPIPEVEKLKHIGGDLLVDRVKGARLLVRPITPRTDLDRIEEQTGLIVPQGAKEKYTPESSTGIIVKVGDAVPEGLYREGEAVLFSKWAGTEFTESRASGNFKAILADDVICTLRAAEGALGDAIKPVERKEAA